MYSSNKRLTISGRRRRKEFESDEGLPDEIMYSIMGKLMGFPVYLARFSAVCKRWHLLVRNSWPKLLREHQIALLVLVPLINRKKEKSSYQIYNLMGRKCVPAPVNSLPCKSSSARIIGSSFGWLILASKDKSNMSISLFNPLSKSHIRMPPLNPHGRYLVKGVLSKPPLDVQHFDIAITMSGHRTITMMAYLHMEKTGELEESMGWVYRGVNGILDVNSIGGRICILYVSGTISVCNWSTYRFCYYSYGASVTNEWHSMFANGNRLARAYLLESSSLELQVVIRYPIEFKIFTLTSNNEVFTEDKVSVMKLMERTEQLQQHQDVLLNWTWTEIKTIGNDVIFLSDNVNSISIQAVAGSEPGSIYFPRGIEDIGVFNVHQNCLTHFDHRLDDTELFLRRRPFIWLMPSYAEILKFSSIG